MEAHEIQHVEVIVATTFVLASEHEHLAIDHGGRMATPSRWHCATQLDERDPLVQAYIHTHERASISRSLSLLTGATRASPRRHTRQVDVHVIEKERVIGISRASKDQHRIRLAGRRLVVLAVAKGHGRVLGSR